MLKKLIKYEWKAMAWNYAAPFLVYIAVCAFSLCLLRWGGPDGQAWGTALLTGGLTVLAVVTFLTFFRRYRRNLYGSEGLLMFTLPVRPESLLLAKLIISFIWFTLFLLLSAAAAVLGLSSLKPGSFGTLNVSALLPALAANWDKLLLMVLYYIIAVIGCILDIYFAITVAQLELWRRFKKLAGFAAYVALNLVLYSPFWFLNAVQHVHIEMAQNLLELRTTDAHGAVSVTTLPVTMSFWLTLAYIAAFHVGVFFLITRIMRRHTTVK